jgi:hypothetical protein
MKKITLLAVAFVAISFASCKKDRVCTCVSDQAGATASVKTYTDAKKGDARAACLSTSQVYTFGTTSTTVKTTCTLK